MYKGKIKAAAVVLALGALIGITANCSSGPSSQGGKKLSFIPGTYYGEADGLWDKINVEVTVNQNAIEEVFIMNHNETGRIMYAVNHELIPAIRRYQSTGLDAVSGATISSRAVLSAVENALQSSGVDINALRAGVRKQQPSRSDETRDVVVVGSGLAGLSTAISLGRDSRLDVLVLEKLAYTGGSATYSGGAIWAHGTEWNRKFGHDWSADDLVRHFHSTSGDARLNDNLIRRIADVSTDYFTYLVQSGAPWDVGNMTGSPEVLGHFETKVSFANVLGASDLVWKGRVNGSTSIGTSRSVECGSSVAMFYERLALRNGAEIRTNSKVEELIIEGGAIKGVVVREGETTYRVFAKKVVLATGGFGYNAEYMETYNTQYAGNVPYCNPGAMGDGITMTKNLGTHIVNSGISGAVGINNPAYGYKRVGLLGSHSPLRINKNGQAIATNADIRTQPDKLAYSIYDSQSQYYTYLEDLVAKRLAFKADTPEQLADAVGNVDKAAFVRSIRNFEAQNPVLNEGGRVPFTPPYYAVLARYTYYNTIAGLEVNDNFQLLNGSNQPIPNLYGVGELVFGNLFSTNYPHIGTSLALTTYGGKIVSDEILKELR
ncbi:MAG: FAD-dependent oxidoreductase [Spirochaetaceae bacterium]|jgi:fumarate reductase flavoprotein subunit|nr:FAD-dependent oxidoreductase [Spirochaetaceae bacterium]